MAKTRFMNDMLKNAGANSTRLRVPARQLRPGDICRGSGAEIVSRPVKDHTDGSRVTLSIRRAPGLKPVTVRWGASTNIGIDRPKENR